MINALVNLSRYSVYRESNAGWAKIIPSHWRSVPLKHALKLVSEIVPTKKTDLKYLGMENVESFTGKIIETTSEVEGVANQFFPGDILFGKLRPYLAKVALPNFSGLCSTEFLVYRLRAGDARYFRYMLVSEGFIDLVNSSTYGFKMPRANADFIDGQKIFFPPEFEQRVIAGFLDKKNTEIDQAISVKEQQIELLKERKQILIQQAVTRGLDPHAPMRDSGIEWIGEIPAHWQTRRFKYLFSQSQLPVRPDDGVVTSYRDGQVTLRSNRRLAGYTEAILEGGYQGVRKGQLVLNSMDAFEGAIGVSESDGKCTPEYVVCDSLSDDYMPEYFAYLLREMALARYIQVICNAVRQRAVRIRFNNLASRFMVVPPIEEQRAIVAHIKAETEKQSTAVALLEQQITKLKEYKATLINSAVTGKIKVPGVVEPAELKEREIA